MENDFERWDIENSKMGYAPDFLTGAPMDRRSALSGFVSSEKAGKRIVKMFGGPQYAWLDFWPLEPTKVRVVVGTDLLNRTALEHLRGLVENAGGRISPDMITQVKSELPAKSQKKISKIRNKNNGPA